MDTYLKNVLSFSEQLNYDGLVGGDLQKLRRLKPDAVIIAGMGGSALPSELLRSVRAEIGLKLPVFIWKDYGLPDPADFGAKHPLHIFVSFSGNTEETISGLKEALRKKTVARDGIAVIAAGGELIRTAEKLGIPRVTFPAGDLTPRQATGRMFYSLIEILYAARLLPHKAPAFRNLDPSRFRAAGRALAKKLQGRLTVIYTDEENRGVGYFWKIRINETAKTQAFAHVMPEMNHNEIVSFENPVVKPVALFIHGKLQGRMAKRVPITQKLLRAHKAEVIDLAAEGKGRLERTWNMIMFADWTSYALSELYKVEAGPVRIVEQLKDLMRK